MTEIAVVTHFSSPRWPLVNKLNGIAKCLNVQMIHCSSFEKAQSTLKDITVEKVLFLTDEGMIDFVKSLHQQKLNYNLDIAYFVQSKIAKVTKEVSQLPKVKYLLEFDEADSFGGRHLAVLLKKFTEQDILNLDKYLGFGAVIHRMTISTAASKRDAVDKIHFFISNLGESTYPHPYNEYARRISEMVDELVINSIFNANPRMQNVDRASDFVLEPSEQVELSWGYDGEYFGVCVRDPFGQFSLESLMSHVGVQPKMENIVASKSAGLGMKMIFDRAHQVITNVQRKKVTEVIAIVKFESRFLDFEKTKKSFFYFTDTPDETTEK